MSGWSRRNRDTSPAGPTVNGGNRTATNPSQGGQSNAAAMERLFAEQDYGTLGRAATERAYCSRTAGGMGSRSSSKSV